MSQPESTLNHTDPSLSLAREHVQVGDVLAGKYRVEKILGTGGMGVVVSASHLQLQEQVALKFLLPTALESDEFNARFLREAQITAKLRNEHVARVMDIGFLESGAPYMVMEYLMGCDLRHVLRTEGQLDVPRAINYVIQAAEGVAEAHSLGIVHRDLKPANLFLTKRPDGSDLVKILDFGISKATILHGSDEELTRSGMMLGSPRYMSPEQIKACDTVDARTDVWSLATILYQLLVRKAPFAGDSPAATVANVLSPEPPPSLRERRPDVPYEVEATIFRALEKEREDRTPSVATFAAELMRALGESVPASMRLSVERMEAVLGPATPAPMGSPASTSPGTDSVSGTYATQGMEAGTQNTGTTMVQGNKKQGLVLGLLALLLLGAGAGAAVALMPGEDPKQPVPAAQPTQEAAPPKAATAAAPPTETVDPETLPEEKPAADDKGEDDADEPAQDDAKASDKPKQAAAPKPRWRPRAPAPKPEPAPAAKPTPKPTPAPSNPLEDRL